MKRRRVDERFPRRGFGRSILEALEARALQLGYTQLHLDTTSRQVAAQRLYESFSYILVRRRPWRDMEILFYEKELRRA